MSVAIVKKSFRSVPFHEWPDIDRLLWNAGTDPGEHNDDPFYVARLRQASMDMAQRAYGSWLDFCGSCEPLDLKSHPADRITRTSMRNYVRQRRKMGNKNATLVSGLVCLRRALRIMLPIVDYSWLTKSICARLPAASPSIQVIDSKVLYDWGIGLMESSLTMTHTTWRLTGYRDGLLITILAARAPRARTIAAFEFGKHIVKSGDVYRAVIGEQDNKTTAIAYDLPDGLTPYIDFYVSTIRCELMSQDRHDWFWVAANGKKLSQGGIKDVVRRRSARRFGKAFGSHRFRHGIATTAALKDPENPSGGAMLLGVSGRILNKHYNRADQVSAAKRYHATIKAERKQTQSLAQRLFHGGASDSDLSSAEGP